VKDILIIRTELKIGFRCFIICILLFIAKILQHCVYYVR